jgi:hypothetical protein
MELDKKFQLKLPCVLALPPSCNPASPHKLQVREPDYYLVSSITPTSPPFVLWSTIMFLHFRTATTMDNIQKKTTPQLKKLPNNQTYLTKNEPTPTLNPKP